MRLRAATFVFLILATGCRADRAGVTKQVIPEVTMDGVEFQVDRRGVPTASGRLERLTYRRDTTDVAASDLTMDLTAAAGPIRLTAPTASGNLAQRHFRVTGGIRATRGADVATTPSAASRPSSDGRIGIHGDEAVQVAGPGYRLTGTGFDLDPATGDLAIRGTPRLVVGLPPRP
jgi:hypothetical protein